MCVHVKKSPSLSPVVIHSLFRECREHIYLFSHISLTRQPRPTRRINPLHFAEHLQIKEAGICPSPFESSPIKAVSQTDAGALKRSKETPIAAFSALSQLSSTIGLQRENLSSWCLQCWAYFLKREIWLLLLLRAEPLIQFVRKGVRLSFCLKSQARFLKLRILQGNNLLGGREYFSKYSACCCLCWLTLLLQYWFT